MQRFVEGDVVDESKDLKNVSDEDVHHLAVLDTRLRNIDRHLENVLLDGNKIIPIDHGCCFPIISSKQCFIGIFWTKPRILFNVETKAVTDSIPIEILNFCNHLTFVCRRSKK